MRPAHRNLFFVGAFAILALWLMTPFIVVVVLDHHLPVNEAGPFGDIYGSVNALFTGLGLLGVFYTLLAQAHRNAEHDSDRRSEQARAVLLTKVSVLPNLIKRE